MFIVTNLSLACPKKMYTSKNTIQRTNSNRGTASSRGQSHRLPTISFPGPQAFQNKRRGPGLIHNQRFYLAIKFHHKPLRKEYEKTPARFCFIAEKQSVRKVWRHDVQLSADATSRWLRHHDGPVQHADLDGSVLDQHRPPGPLHIQVTTRYLAREDALDPILQSPISLISG